MRRLALIVACLGALLLIPAAYAATTTTYTISATSTRSAVVHWTTTSAGDLTLTLRYSAKTVPAFNVWATDANGSPTGALGGLCSTTSGTGWITYSCVNAPASAYEAAIWPDKGQLSGVLTVTGQTA